MSDKRVNVSKGLLDNLSDSVQALKQELANYDYIGVKIAMGVATVEQYKEQIAYTEKLRARIRELEGTE